jgi:hypothetical protein
VTYAVWLYDRLALLRASLPSLQLQLERMRRQEVAFASAERQEQQQLLQQQVHQQAVALEAARQQAVQAEAQAKEAKQEVRGCWRCNPLK